MPLAATTLTAFKTEPPLYTRDGRFAPRKMQALTPTGFHQQRVVIEHLLHPPLTHVDACARLVRDGDAHGTAAADAGVPLLGGAQLGCARAASLLRGGLHGVCI